MPVEIARRAKNIPKMAIEILDVGIATECEFVLSEAKHLKQDTIVEPLRAQKI